MRMVSGWRRIRERLVETDETNNRFLGVVLGAVRSYSRAEAGDGAAALTFYAVFSLFPLLSIAVTVASLLAGPEMITGLLMSILGPIFPPSYEVMQQSIERFVQSRGTVSVVGVISLIWAASGAFAILVKYVNQAWETARVRNFLQGRLLALGLVGGILVLLILILLAALLLRVIVQTRIFIPPLLPILISPFRPLLLFLVQALPFFIAFFAFLFMYRFLPTTHVRYREAFWGALVVSVVWALSSTLFGAYMNASSSRFNLLYGPVAAIAVLMIWIYFNNVMILFGAHLSAALSRRRLKKKLPQVTVKEEQQ